MPDDRSAPREGSLEAPTRHPIDWKSPSFWDEAALEAELERVFGICHSCRRCVSLCNAYPTLFALVDASSTMEIDGVAKSDYAKVVEQCYLCDLCYQSKCPYVPPHEWNVDFPHLMLRAKAVRHRKGETTTAAKLLSNTHMVGRLASIPVVVEAVNWGNRNATLRGAMEKTLGVHRDAQVPKYESRTARKRLKRLRADGEAQPAGPTTGKVALFVTCYGNFNQPRMVEDLAAVLAHNGVQVKLLRREHCCGMPKLEQGDLDCVEKYKDMNLPLLAQAVKEGFDLIAPIPSCVLMFKQELPLLFPGDIDVARVKRAFYDPFEYLMHRHAAGLLKTDFKDPLGKVAWQVACHQRVQKIGPKTRDVLSLVPGTEVVTIERCSGHDGTYGVKKDTYPISRRIAKPVETRAKNAAPQYFTSDCVMAGAHIAHGLNDGTTAEHPVSLLRKAYGI
ncbi:MAG TPA: heterodisulfide reductase-related iron-sulfur binding cluster [Xanthomonadaceae bacterium]|jgi:Fe-S oxidoreductase